MTTFFGAFVRTVLMLTAALVLIGAVALSTPIPALGEESEFGGLYLVEPDPVTNTCLSPESISTEGSVQTFGGGFPTLQSLLDAEYGGGYIDAYDDQTNFEQWNGDGSTVDFTFHYAGGSAGNRHVFGYSLNDSPFIPVFKDGDIAGYESVPSVEDTVTVSVNIPNTSNIIFVIYDEYLDTYYLTERYDNEDDVRHAVVYNPDSNLYVIGFEDQWNQGDKDFNDMIVEVKVDGCTAPEDNDDGDAEGEYRVYTYKHLLAVDAETSAQVPDNAEGVPQFSMTETITAANVNDGAATTSAYTLGTEGVFTASSTLLAEGASYETSEVTDGSTVIPAAGACVENKYRLVGYKTGATLEAAEGATLSTSTPSFANLESDQHVIVVNEDCDEVLDGSLSGEVVSSESDNSRSRSRGNTRGNASGGQVLGASACSALLSDYLHKDWNNDAEEVKKLQQFLNDQVGTSLPLSGFFGPATFEAVKLYQKNYWESILKPWFAIPNSGIGSQEEATGFVYKTTRWSINNIWCAGSEAFPSELN